MRVSGLEVEAGPAARRAPVAHEAVGASPPPWMPPGSSFGGPPQATGAGLGAPAHAPLPSAAVLGMIEHDIRTAATVISGYTRLLLDERVGSLGADQRNFLLETERAAGRISGLLDDLREFESLGRSREFEIRGEPLALHEILHGVVAALRPSWSERGQSVELELLAAHDEVRGDPRQLERVFGNLVQNAINFGPPGQKLRIATQTLELEAPRMIRVTIEDEGPGVCEAELDRIFEPFARGSAAAAGSDQGVGLGLSICRWVVEAHDGEIEVLSASAGGARFCVCLPLAGHGRGNGQAE